MLDGTGNAAGHIQVRTHRLAGLPHLAGMIHHPGIHHGAGRGDLAAQLAGQRLQFVEPGPVVHAASAGNQHLGFGNILAATGLAGAFQQFHLDFRSVENGTEGTDFALPLRLRLPLAHHTGTHRGHLRTVVRADDGRHQVAAESGTGHPELLRAILLFGNLQLGAVGCQAGFQPCRQPRRQVTPDGGGTVQHNAWPVFHNHLINHLRILLRQVFLQLRAVGHQHLVGAHRYQLLRLVADALTQQHGHHLFARNSGQVTRLAYQFVSHRLDLAFTLFCKHKYVLVFLVFHTFCL